MIENIQMYDCDGALISRVEVKLPDVCPHCNTAVRFIVENYPTTSEQFYGIKLLCPACEHFSLFEYSPFDSNDSLYPQAIFTEIQPPKNVSELSPSFHKIYNEAARAESLGMHELSGIGYRKSLEFLIKDFAIFANPSDEDSIKHEFLSRTIDRMSHPKIKTLAEKAAWLGNDETHYVKKHTDLDVKDLKRFIDAAVKFIDLELTVLEADSIKKK